MIEQKRITIENFKEAKGILDGLGIKFWLTLGTSLGAYRDKDFCPGDIDDIDLGVDCSELKRSAEIKKAFADKGWNLIREWDIHDGISVEYSFQKLFPEYRVKVDLWFYSPNPENSDEVLFRMYHHTGNHHTYRLPKRFHEEFQEIEFFGEKYLIPKDIEGYLEYNYGKDWKTPIHRSNWNYHTDNKSKMYGV